MEKQAFISLVGDAAVKGYTYSKVLPSVVVAQACLESNYGKSAPNNNLFGVKGTGSNQTTKEFVDGKWITIVAGFRSYDSFLDSINDHADLLLRLSRYSKVIGNIDASDTCRKLQSAGYATDPNYADKLINIIHSYALDRFDEEVLDVKLDDNVTDFILSVLGKYWTDMKGNADVQNYTHVVANELRKAVGRKPE